MEYFIGITVMLLIVILFKTPVGSGFYRRWMMRLVIGKNRPKKDLFVLHDLRFYDGTKSVTIDHVIINKDGVHIITTHFEFGVIQGKEHDKEWTISTSFGKHKTLIINPIKQINGYTLSLKQVMPMNAPLYAYICFPGNAKIKVKSVGTPVVGPGSLLRQVKQKRQQNDLLKPIEVRKLYEALKDLKKQTFKHQHITIDNSPKKSYQKDSYLKDER